MPQGSILGPLLFILYINDFSKSSDLLFSILFADDTSVFIEGTAYSSIINDMNRELEKVDAWLKSNKLTLSILKTHYVMFHRTRIKHKAPEIKVHISGNNIVCVNNTKFLGLIIDSKLNWSSSSSSSFVSSNRILPFVYTFSGIFVELLKVIQSAGMC